MNGLRSKWGKRGVVALLLVSLLPPTFATVAFAAQRTDSLASWVRMQLREPADAAVEQALEQAERSAAGSLEAFLAVFVEAYEAQRPEKPLAHAFATRALSNAALIAYLQGRFLGFVGEVIFLRTVFVAAKMAVKKVSERSATPLVVLPRRDQVRGLGASPLQGVCGPVFIPLLRVLSAAQPLGP